MRRTPEETFWLLCCSAAELDLLPAKLAALRERGLSWEAVQRRMQTYPFADGHAPLWNGIDGEPHLRSLLPPGILERIEKFRSRVVHANQHRIAALLELLDRLEMDGVRPVVVKGPALILAGYYRIGERWFNDVDLLVDRETAAIAERSLQSLGYYGLACYEKYRERYLSEHHHLPPLFKNIGGSLRLCVEIQWQASGYLPSPRFTNRLCSQARVVTRSDGRPVRVPSPEGLLVHGILDVMSHNLQKGLKTFCDLQRIASGGKQASQDARMGAIFEELNLTAEAALVRELLRKMLCCEAPCLGVAAKEQSDLDAILRAAEELILHRPKLRFGVWRLLARWLTASRGAGVEQLGEPTSLHGENRSIVHRLATAGRFLTTIPEGAARIRNEAAAIVMQDWIQQQHLKRDNGAGRQETD